MYFKIKKSNQKLKNILDKETKETKRGNIEKIFKTEKEAYPTMFPYVEEDETSKNFRVNENFLIEKKNFLFQNNYFLLGIDNFLNDFTCSYGKIGNNQGRTKNSILEYKNIINKDIKHVNSNGIKRFLTDFNSEIKNIYDCAFIFYAVNLKTLNYSKGMVNICNLSYIHNFQPDESSTNLNEKDNEIKQISSNKQIYISAYSIIESLIPIEERSGIGTSLNSNIRNMKSIEYIEKNIKIFLLKKDFPEEVRTFNKKLSFIILYMKDMVDNQGKSLSDQDTSDCCYDIDYCLYQNRKIFMSFMKIYEKSFTYLKVNTNSLYDRLNIISFISNFKLDVFLNNPLSNSLSPLLDIIIMDPLQENPIQNKNFHDNTNIYWNNLDINQLEKTFFSSTNTKQTQSDNYSNLLFFISYFFLNNKSSFTINSSSPFFYNQTLLDLSSSSKRIFFGCTKSFGYYSVGNYLFSKKFPGQLIFTSSLNPVGIAVSHQIQSQNKEKGESNEDKENMYNLQYDSINLGFNENLYISFHNPAVILLLKRNLLDETPYKDLYSISDLYNFYYKNQTSQINQMQILNHQRNLTKSQGKQVNPFTKIDVPCFSYSNQVSEWVNSSKFIKNNGFSIYKDKTFRNLLNLSLKKDGDLSESNFKHNEKFKYIRYLGIKRLYNEKGIDDIGRRLYRNYFYEKVEKKDFKSDVLIDIIIRRDEEKVEKLKCLDDFLEKFDEVI